MPGTSEVSPGIMSLCFWPQAWVPDQWLTAAPGKFWSLHLGAESGPYLFHISLELSPASDFQN